VLEGFADGMAATSREDRVEQVSVYRAPLVVLAEQHRQVPSVVYDP
jgi:hypothetical protein